MAVYLFFGLPGCGKTTLMSMLASKFVKGKKYQNVYGNVHMKIDGYTYIDNDCIGSNLLENGAILIDEATLFADSRQYKSFSKERLQFFLEHRHFNVDIYLFTQQWDGVDRKIRVITDRVYYVYKGKLLGHWWSTYYRIPYGIIIPDPNKKGASGEKLGEIIQGYCKPNILIRLFAPKVFRPFYYKYFDSWEKYDLPELPKHYKPYQSTSASNMGAVATRNEAHERSVSGVDKHQILFGMRFFIAFASLLRVTDLNKLLMSGLFTKKKS